MDLEQKQVRFGNGRVASYDVLINTTPLDRFVAGCTGVPEQVADAVAVLVHNGGLIVGVGLEQRRGDSKCWMYFPESNSPFYRVTNFHNYSPYNVPAGDTSRYSSLMCETTYSDYKTVGKDAIVEQTVDGLVSSGMLADGERNLIVSQYLIDIPYSYPVPTLGRDKALGAIQPYLESRSVYSRGRFGAWKYEVGNMDHSFMQGVEVVERILTGKEETTLHGGI